MKSREISGWSLFMNFLPTGPILLVEMSMRPAVTQGSPAATLRRVNVQVGSRVLQCTAFLTRVVLYVRIRDVLFIHTNNIRQQCAMNQIPHADHAGKSPWTGLTHCVGIWNTGQSEDEKRSLLVHHILFTTHLLPSCKRIHLHPHKASKDQNIDSSKKLHSHRLFWTAHITAVHALQAASDRLKTTRMSAVAARDGMVGYAAKWGGWCKWAANRRREQSISIFSSHSFVYRLHNWTWIVMLIRSRKLSQQTTPLCSCWITVGNSNTFFIYAVIAIYKHFIEGIKLITRMLGDYASQKARSGYLC